jgi:predicted transcriptional regulator
MVTERIDVRLDPERRRRLADLSKKRGLSISAIVREALDALYEAEKRAERMAAAERIGAMAIEDMPEPEELSRQLDETYATPLP